MKEVFFDNLVKAVRFIFILELVMAIHEFGHLTEMQKRGVEVKEFSLGIGPILYQQPINNIQFSLRAIPLVAYVRPTKAGAEKEANFSFWERFAIGSAGVRNNVLSGLGAVLVLQFFGMRKKAPLSFMIKNAFKTIIYCVILFLGFVVETFTVRRYELPKKFLLRVPLDPPYFIQQFIYWSFFLAFVNIMPFYPLDGGKLFVEEMTILFGSAIETAAKIFSSILLYYAIWFGVSNMEFVTYDSETPKPAN